MTDMLAAEGLINTDSITHWKIDTEAYKYSDKSFGVKAMIGPEIVIDIHQRFVPPIPSNSVIEKGIVLEAIHHVISESRVTGKPCYIRRAMALAMQAVRLMVVENGKENSDLCDDTLRKILSAGEGTYITVEGFDEPFTRVGAFVLLRNMTPQKSISICLHDRYEKITEIFYGL